MTKLIINLPFMGFYESGYDAELMDKFDSEIRFKSCAYESPDETLDESEISDVLHDCCDWRAMCQEVAKQYVGYFADYLWRETGLHLASLAFDEWISPREYNFTTDRIMASTRPSEVEQIYFEVKRENLADMIRERHTSKDGFVSFYSNNINKWLYKPIEEWDHNELGTLIRAFVEQELDADWEWDVIARMQDADVFSTAFQNGVDWGKFEEDLAKARKEKELT